MFQEFQNGADSFFIGSVSNTKVPPESLKVISVIISLEEVNSIRVLLRMID
jgi:hypothetical protein